MQASKLFLFSCGEISVSAPEHPERVRTKASEAIGRDFILSLYSTALVLPRPAYLVSLTGHQ